MNLVLLLLSLFAYANGLQLQYPLYPEVNYDSVTSWSEGVPPYRFDIFEVGMSTVLYSYGGNDTSATWNFTVTENLQVVFSVVDATGVNITSPLVSVLGPLLFVYIPFPAQGSNETIVWEGGVGPYNVSVISPTGNVTYANQPRVSIFNATFSFASIAAGTELNFQVVDENGINITSLTYTVYSPPPPQATLSSMSILSLQSIQSTASVASTATLTPTPTPTPLPPSKTNAKKSNSGAIIGGVIGGGVALALFALLLLCLMKKPSRRRRGQSLSTPFSPYEPARYSPNETELKFTPSPISEEGHFDQHSDAGLRQNVVYVPAAPPPPIISPPPVILTPVFNVTPPYQGPPSYYGPPSPSSQPLPAFPAQYTQSSLGVAHWQPATQSQNSSSSLGVPVPQDRWSRSSPSDVSSLNRQTYYTAVSHSRTGRTTPESHDGLF